MGISCLLLTCSTKSWVTYLTIKRTQHESNPERLNSNNPPTTNRGIMTWRAPLQQNRQLYLKIMHPCMLGWALVICSVSFILWLLQCPSSKEESSFVPASPCPVDIGLLALRTDTLFTPALKGTGVSIYLHHGYQLGLTFVGLPSYSNLGGWHRSA